MKTTFTGDLHAPGAARRWVASAMSDLVRSAPGPRLDDVVLVVSELVTNSVRAGAREVDVELVSTADDVELHVTDDAAGWPETRAPDWDEVQGRGLAIVADVADRWHTTRLRHGKRVTAQWSRSGDQDVVGHLC
ncbi:MAG TPA: ATP-binding protein [Marmoricola sp.]|nr:ATP-binding protein [Marmoricola sp.]